MAGDHCCHWVLHLPYEGLVVDQPVEQLHDQQATQPYLIRLAAGWTRSTAVSDLVWTGTGRSTAAA
jgi:hypothetical protein